MTPWMFGPHTFTVPGGTPSLVELKVPPRGRIRAIRLFQTDGSAVTATLQILQSLAAAKGKLDPADENYLAFDGNPAVQSVFGSKSVPTDGLEETDKAYDYQNQDSDQTTVTRRLWMVITPGGSGDKTYTLALMIADLLQA